MRSLCDMAKQQLTDVLNQFCGHKNVAASLLAIETVFMYEIATQKPRRKTFGANKKPYPQEWTHEQHVEKLTKIFQGQKQIERTSLVKLLMLSYEVGQNKVEQDDGYLPFLRRNDYIKPIDMGRYYSIGERCSETETI